MISNPPVAPAPVPFETPKLKLATETLEKRCDELSASLDTAIADIEAGAIDPRLGSWLDWIGERRRAATVTIALAGKNVAERFAELCDEGAAPSFEGYHLATTASVAGNFDVRAIAVTASKLAPDVCAIALLDLDALAQDAFTLGTLRRDCAGLVWLGTQLDIPPVLADLFRESVLGIYSLTPHGEQKHTVRPELAPWYSMPAAIRPFPLPYILSRLVPEGAAGPVATLFNAKLLTDLAAGVVAEHARENARLAVQAALGERSKNAKSLVEELNARKEMLVELRDDLNRDLAANVDEITKYLAQVDPDEMFRGSVKRSLDMIPALQDKGDKLTSRKMFEEVERPQWWTGTGWARFQAVFAHKIRLSLPSSDLEEFVGHMTGEMSAIVSKAALRRVDKFNGSIDDFTETALSVGVDLKPAAIPPEERERWERKGAHSAPQQRSAASLVSGFVPLEERCRRSFETTAEKDLKSFHIDIERKGPIGKVMEGRAAVGGLSALLLLAVRGVGTWGKLFDPVAITGATGVTALLINSSYYAIPLLLIGFVIHFVTSGGKEDAVVHEKISEARESFDDKLASTTKRFFDGELGEVKAALTEHKAAAVDRLDRAIEGLKQEIEELDRRGRGSTTPARGRTGLAALPMSLKGDGDKTALAMKDVRLEITGRYLAPPPVPVPAPAANAAAAPRPAASATPVAPPAPTNPALIGLAERAARRAAAAAASAAANGQAPPPKPEA